MVEEICQKLDDFEKRYSDYEVQSLLDEFRSVCALSSSGLPEKVVKKSQVLLEYFFEKEDVASIEKFMKYRSRSYFHQAEYDKERENYKKRVEQYPEPQFSDYARMVLGYGEYRVDIARLMKLCGKLDKQTAPREAESVYYSPMTQKIIISATIGEYGALAKHVYADGEFGVYDHDRNDLMYWHNEGFEQEKTREL